MQEKYANIIIDISHEKVDRPFQYRIPPALLECLEVGMEVYVPFGSGNTRRSGYVIEITDEACMERTKLKEILEIAESRAGVEGNLIRLAGWIKERYGSTMITALKTVLPAKQKVRALEKKTVELVLPETEAMEKLEQYRTKHHVARERLLSELIREKSLSMQLVTQKLSIPPKTIESMREQGVLRILSEQSYRNPVTISEQSTARNRLSAAQKQIVEDILRNQENRGRSCLIHGITGSGKTEVYMALIEAVIQNGKQAIVLIPEIALTYQTLLRFYRRFGERVSVMNSRLSQGERYDQMERAKKGELDVMIGPRSALFTPFSRLGIIVIDEEHEPSYKSETMPKYHAREVAEKLALMHGACVVMGSATPSLEAYYRAKSGEITLYELNERLTGGTLPAVYIEDLRKELREGNRSIFSRRLHGLIGERLERREQIILFINRRGYAGFISCRSCGHVMKCPHCDVSLSEHKNGKLVCHYCGYAEPAVSKCPECGSKYIMGFRAGTQQIEELLHKNFPAASVLRMDADTTKTKESYEEILSSFANRKADILIGTQMIVKGHDFPHVTLVGILAADLSLAANDYRAGERTFQLLTQAAGRAGRGGHPGEVVIQTYQPDHYSIQHAAKQDYRAFYEEEILYRELLRYPPASHMMAVLIISRSEERGEKVAGAMAEHVRPQCLAGNGAMIGPAPATVGKLNDCYRFVFYVKQPDNGELIRIRDELEQFCENQLWSEETIQFDFDPMSAY